MQEVLLNDDELKIWKTEFTNSLKNSLNHCPSNPNMRVLIYDIVLASLQILQFDEKFQVTIRSNIHDIKFYNFVFIKPQSLPANLNYLGYAAVLLVNGLHFHLNAPAKAFFMNQIWRQQKHFQ